MWKFALRGATVDMHVHLVALRGAAVGLLVHLVACSETHGFVDDVGAAPDVGPGIDATDSLDAYAADTGPGEPMGVRIAVRHVEEVDLLFMIDSSNSMLEEQASLIEELPRVISVLASGDRDGDGLRDFSPISSVHVGIVTSDMGAGPNVGVPTCLQGLGDDGILRSTSRSTTAPCLASFPSGIFAFASDVDDPAAFAATVSCVANVGTGGCGFEQQLEASLKALTPSRAAAWTRAGYTPPLFVSAEGIPNSVSGNGESPTNVGFLRPTSALGVILLTDEEDCSVIDYNLFVPGDSRFDEVPLNRRCNQFGAPDLRIVHPVDRYVAGFLGLRTDPSLLVFAGIVGIPPATEAAAAAGDYATVLSHPSMVPTADATGNNLVPSCTTDNGTAFPPVRIVQTAAGLAAAGARISLSSICNASYRPAVDQLLSTLTTALRGPCLPLPLSPQPDGRINCEVHELLPPEGESVVSSCADLPGRTLVRTVVDEALGHSRELCSVTQVDRATAIANSAPGWYYDDFDSRLPELCGATPYRIAFTPSAPPVPGSELRLLCP